MKDYRFKHWLEYADFGLGVNDKKQKKTIRDDDEGEGPTQPLNIEYVVNSLKKSPIGSKFPMPNDFFGELQWGEQAGALRLTFTPFAGTRVIIRKLSHDLNGDPIWICHKVLEVKNLYDDSPDSLTLMLQDVLIEMDHQGIDTPVADFKDMQRLVIRIAGKLRCKNTQNIFMYEGIRMIKPNEEYIIHWGVTGMGRQARGQQRVDQFAIHCTYSPKIGTIKVTGTEIGGKLDNYTWYYNQPSNFNEIFVAGQGGEEISHSVLTLFNTF